MVSSLPRVAVLRGGNTYHAESIASGFGLLDSLTNQDIEVVDVYIDEDMIWHIKGVVTDPHAVFATVDGYIDTTGNTNASYHALAQKMGLAKLLFEEEDEHLTDRETIYRLLRQAEISVPDTKVVRTASGVSLEMLHHVWKSLHTPYLLRPLKKESRVSSVYVDSFDGFKEKAWEWTEAGVDFLILPYKSVRTLSLAVLPEYRGQALYIPLPVASLSDARVTPNKDSKLVVHRTDEQEHKTLHLLIKKVYDALLLRGPALIDVITTKDGYTVVEVQARPSLRSDGRFMQSLQSTGVSLGHYIATKFHDSK